MDHKIYFKNLDGLRFIAFFFVFLQHAIFASIKCLSSGDSSFTNSILTNIFSNGTLGVSFFFVLSGFLITYLLLIEKNNPDGHRKQKINLRKFYLRRALRIWPLYFLVMIVVMIIIPLAQNHLGLGNINAGIPAWPYFTFLSNFQVIHNEVTGANFASIRDISWTISVEEQFYLVWPLIIIIFSKKLLPYIFSLIIIISIVFKTYCIMNNLNNAYLSYHTLSVMSDLAIGGILAWTILFSKNTVKKIEHISKGTIMLVYGFGFFYILLKGILFSFYDYRIVQGLFFCFIIAEQNFCKNSFYKIGSNKIISSLGQISYGLYLFHALAYFFLDYLFRYTEIYYPTFISLFSLGVLSFLLTILISRLSYNYFEAIFLRMKKRFTAV